MNAHTTIPTHRQTYGVIECPTCDGRGSIPNGHGLGGNDPDSWEVECRNCDGDGHFPCAACGFSTVIAGYDCLACETVRGISSADLLATDADSLADAMHAAAVAEYARLATVDRRAA